MSPAYLLALRDYEPGEVVRALALPILVIQAGRDYQVTMKDFDIWENALRGKANVTLKVLPKLNHLLIEGEGMSRPEEYFAEGHVSEEAVDTIARWIKAVD